MHKKIKHMSQSSAPKQEHSTPEEIALEQTRDYRPADFDSEATTTIAFNLDREITLLQSTSLSSTIPSGREEFTDSSIPEESLVLEEKYELSAVLGKGGMAKVWRAEDQELQRTVALKVMQSRSKIDVKSHGQTEAARKPHVLSILIYF